MTVARWLLVVALTGLLVSACSDDDPTGGGTGTPPAVDDLLARVCDLAGDCGGSTPADIAACPAELLTELDDDDIAELEAFLALNTMVQDRILACFAEEVCGRFGGSVLSLSDSDVMEPLRGCAMQVGR